jgi:hypothetical protein
MQVKQAMQFYIFKESRQQKKSHFSFFKACRASEQWAVGSGEKSDQWLVGRG